MPFCPKCRYEYNPGISICPDCDETLVSYLPEETDEDIEFGDFEDWVRIGRLTSQSYADLLEGGLEDKDIPVIILSGTGHFGETGQMGTSSYRPIDGGYSIMVPREFAADADIEAETILGEDWVKARIPNSEW